MRQIRDRVEQMPTNIEGPAGAFSPLLQPRSVLVPDALFAIGDELFASRIDIERYDLRGAFKSRVEGVHPRPRRRIEFGDVTSVERVSIVGHLPEHVASDLPG